MVAMMEEILADCKEEAVDLTEKERKLITHNILVAGQMWTFRRWALRRHFTLEEYINLQIKNLIHN